MIIANISTYQGQCADAEHYYCHYEKVEDSEPKERCYIGHGDVELQRKITTESESKYLTEKAGRGAYRYRVGNEINRFNTIDQIHQELLKLFPDEIIVSYKESDIFSEMLYWKDGKNLGIEAFGEVWSCVPNGCYKDLIPSNAKFKCYECGREYTLEEISTEREWNDRIQVKFKRPYEMGDDRCCQAFDIEWNITL